MLKVNSIKAFALAVGLTSLTACATQNRVQDTKKSVSTEGFRKSNVSTGDSFVSTQTVTPHNKVEVQKFQPAEYIEFTPAKTMEEAIKFAKENFGTTLKLGNNLAAANFVNELLANVNNKMKGKSALPKEVVFDRLLVSDDWKPIYAAWSNIMKRLSFGATFIKEFETAEKEGKSFMDFLKEKSITNPNRTPYSITAIYHEIGHANHYKNCNQAYKMASLDVLKARRITDTHFTEEFLNDVKNNPELRKYYRSWALSSPVEFVADTFAEKILGKKIPEKAEELYIKYGGMPVPE